MKRAAMIVAPGFEEGETLTIVDILRRADIVCDLVGFSDTTEGAHAITVRCDRKIGEDIVDYDMIILPGGYSGAENLRDSDFLMNLLKIMSEQGKYICAMCAAPIALERAGLLFGRNYTAYMGYDQKIKEGTYLEDKVVVDGNIVTGRGPATAYAFAYKLVDLLGGDSWAVKERMLYFHAFDVKEDE